VGGENIIIEILEEASQGDKVTEAAAKEELSSVSWLMQGFPIILPMVMLFIWVAFVVPRALAANYAREAAGGCDIADTAPKVAPPGFCRATWTCTGSVTPMSCP